MTDVKRPSLAIQSKTGGVPIVATAKMLVNRRSAHQCIYGCCRIDLANKAKERRLIKRRERREWKREVS